MALTVAPPITGPGNTVYYHQTVQFSKAGEGNAENWIFYPSGPVPEKAPVIVFNHGWGGVSPVIYGGWIEHLVRKGNLVIFPRYQESFRVQPASFVQNASEGVRLAFERLPSFANRSQFAIMGHSMGGLITANMGALWQTLGLPKPRALMIVQPGISTGWTGLPLADLSAIPSDIWMVVVTGDKDSVVGTADGVRIFQGTPQVSRKSYIHVRSDPNGLKASHFFPACPGLSQVATQESDSSFKARMAEYMENKRGPDAFDWYGTWKWSEALLNAAFQEGKNQGYVLGGGSQETFMGTWSDGTPVQTPVVVGAGQAETLVEEEAPVVQAKSWIIKNKWLILLSLGLYLLGSKKGENA